MLYNSMNTLRLTYLKGSLEISRVNGWKDSMAMWNISGANHTAFPDNTTLTLESIKTIKVLGLNQAAKFRLGEHK